MSTLSNFLVELDRRHFIHPVVSPHAHERKGVRVLTSGKGFTVTDSTG